MGYKAKWFIKKGVVIMLVIAIILVALYGVMLWRFYAVEPYDVGAIASSDGQITVMSSNVRNHNLSDLGNKSWYVRAELQLEQIADVAPDIIGFQEVKRTQQYYFTQKLVGYDSVIFYREDKLTAEATPIYYKTDKFNLVESGGFWLSETPEVCSTDWGTSFPRICTYVVLEEIATGKVFAVFNTHLDHTSDLARTNGIQVILNKIDELGNIPAILMGDMNDSEDSLMYDMATENFLDVKYQAKSSMTAPTFNGFGTVSPTDFNWLLDYFFITPECFTVESYQVLNTKADGGIYRSDHNPIVCKLKLT